jgi:hypothetical protein
MAGTAASAQTGPGVGYDRAALTQAICRQYAAAQRGMPYDTMYAQCMYARSYRVPGFSPSPDSPGYLGSAAGERDDVIFAIAGASPAGPAGRRAGMLSLKFPRYLTGSVFPG